MTSSKPNACVVCGRNPASPVPVAAGDEGERTRTCSGCGQVYEIGPDGEQLREGLLHDHWSTSPSEPSS